MPASLANGAKNSSPDLQRNAASQDFNPRCWPNLWLRSAREFLQVRRSCR
jgi:hypothetical protein